MENTVTGVLKINKEKASVLLDPARSFKPAGPADPIVPVKLIKQYDMKEGAVVTGSLMNDNHKKIIDKVHSICGLSPEDFRKRTHYTALTAIDPKDRFHLSISNEKSMRIIDLIAPIGKGTRGLIVSPPRAGKTTILMQIAKAIRKEKPDSQIIVFLIDERPEEVTHFKRSVEAEVIASSSDQSPQEHMALAELTLSHIQVNLECNKDVVVLVDSLTRMGRAFNQRAGGSGRIMSGGMEAGAMAIPRKFFGLARNIEGGGSVTIIATALVNTGSRMDELIFQEFKGTGNSEIVLDRSMAEQNLFPAINVTESGTRREEYLYDEKEYQKISNLRKALSVVSPREKIEMILDLIEKYPTNEELLDNIPGTL
ncbi:MAG: transcription termination factor Rho [Spirochaetes bacterium]|nr:transcription termination factor Rho [Spirochaetota bacterium]